MFSTCSGFLIILEQEFNIVWLLLYCEGCLFRVIIKYVWICWKNAKNEKRIERKWWTLPRTEEKERKRQKIIRDQKKAERVQYSVKLKRHREYERKRKSEQRKKKKITEKDGVEQDGRKASGKRTRKANLVKKNNQIQILTVMVAKLTNHNRRLPRKLKKKDITPCPQYCQVPLLNHHKPQPKTVKLNHQKLHQQTMGLDHQKQWFRLCGIYSLTCHTEENHTEKRYFQDQGHL